jgi:hypothetical protein
VEEAVGVDPSGEPDQRVDRCEHEYERERVLPERHADERTPGREDERRGQREDGQHVRERAAGVGGDGDVADEVGADERVRHRLSGGIRVLLSRGERAGCGVCDRVERETQRKPWHDQGEAAAERGRGVEDAGGEQGRGEPGDDCELPESEQPDSDHLAGEEVARPHRRQDQLDDAVVLLLDDAADHPLPIHGKGHEQEQGGHERDEGRGIGGSGVERFERCHRQLRCRRQLAAKRAHGRVRDGGELRVHVCAEDEPVVAQEQERIDIVCHERLTSCCR